MCALAARDARRRNPCTFSCFSPYHTHSHTRPLEEQHGRAHACRLATRPACPTGPGMRTRPRSRPIIPSRHGAARLGLHPGRIFRPTSASLFAPSLPPFVSLLHRRWAPPSSTNGRPANKEAAPEKKQLTERVRAGQWTGSVACSDPPPPQTCTRRVRAGRPRPCGPDRCFPRAGRAEAGAIAIFGRQGLVCPQLGTSAPPPGPPAARSSWARPPSGLRANSLDRRGGEGAARREESPIFLPSLTMLGRLLGVHPARLQPMTRELLAGGGSVAGVRRG